MENKSKEPLNNTVDNNLSHNTQPDKKPEAPVPAEVGKPIPPENPVPAVSDPEPKPGKVPPMQYTYRWTYGDQVKFDSKEKKRRRRARRGMYAAKKDI